MSSETLLSDLQVYVDRIVAKHGVPAMSVAVWHRDKLHRAASGVLNVETGVTATVDSVFQIGSISKVFTASLIMLLVDQGKVELDKPVKHYLPDFHVADPEATQTITVRHLLSHSGGLVSDFSHAEDADEGETSIVHYVDRYFLLPQIHPHIGKKFSYSNAGYVLAGRLIEVVSGMSWRKAVERYILQPLGMTQSLACPTQVLRFRAAMGHILSGTAQDAKVSVHPRCYLPLAMAPTGSVLTMSAADLVKFGKAHLSGGKTESGEQWMSRRSVASMQAVQVSLPGPGILLEHDCGLGWMLGSCQGVRLVGHAGGTTGQLALLQILPEHQCVFSVQVNGAKGGSTAVLDDVLADLLHEIAGVRPQRPTPTGEKPAHAERFTGRFGGAGFIWEISESDGDLYAHAGGFSIPMEKFVLRLLGENRFTAYTASGEQMMDFTFVDPDCHGRPMYLYFCCRLYGRM